MPMVPRSILLASVAGALAALAFVLLADDPEPEEPRRALGQSAVSPVPEAERDTAVLDAPAAPDAGGGGRSAAPVEPLSPAARRAARQAAAKKPAAATAPYTGRLVDPAGAPVRDAGLELRAWSQRDELQVRVGRFGPPPWPTGRTDKDGRFSIPHDERIGKSIAVIPDARGFLDEPLQHVLADAAEPDLGDVFLERAVIVRGLVLDDRGAAIAGAELRRGSRDEDPSARAIAALGFGGLLSLGASDEHGRFELEHARGGELTLVAVHPEHLTAQWKGTAPDAGFLDDVRIEMRRAGSISGVVDGFPTGRRGAQIAARRLPDASPAGAGDEVAAAEDGAAAGGSRLIEAMLMPAGTEMGEIEPDGRFVVHGLVRTGRYELTVVERQEFVRTVALSESVRVDSGSSGVVIEYDAGATVRMRVRDAETKRPIEVAEVTGNWGNDRARIFLAPDAVTRPKRFEGGVIRLYELRPPADPGSLSLKLTAPGYVERRLASFDVGARDFVELGDVELEPSPKLRFLVVDRTTGKPIARAQVSVREPSDLEPAELWRRGMDAAGRSVKDRTGKDGRVELDSIDAPVAHLTIRADEYPTYRRLDFPPRDTEREHRIELVKGGDLEVYVVDPAGQPVAGACVARRVQGAGNEDTEEIETTNGDGLARWRTCDAGRYEVRAFRRGADPANEPGAEVAWHAADVASARTTEVVLEVGAAATLAGTVALNGAPLAGAELRLESYASVLGVRATPAGARRRDNGFGRATPSGTTDAEGRFELVDVLPGTYDLVIGHRSLLVQAEERVELERGPNHVDVRLDAAGVEGRVLDDRGEPLAGARVAANRVGDVGPDSRMRPFRSLTRDESREARTDGEGRFRLVGLPAGEPFELTARATGHVASTGEPLTLAPAESRANVELRLSRAGSVEVVLVSDVPNPAAAFVRARFAGEGSHEDVVEVVQGTGGVVDGLAPGPWDLTLRTFGPSRGGGASSATVRATVVAGERAVVEIPR